jgi:hypothetical protein
MPLYRQPFGWARYTAKVTQLSLKRLIPVVRAREQFCFARWQFTIIKAELIYPQSVPGCVASTQRNP